MTRLQKMFLDLSQYRTVNELEKATSEQFVDDLFTHLAFDENGKVHTCGYFSNCMGCSIGCNKSDNSPYILTVDYLNAEIDGSRPHRNSIIVLRERALESLKNEFDIAKKNNLNPTLVAIALDDLCNKFEEIGLFEPNECHDMLIKVTKGRPKK